MQGDISQIFVLFCLFVFVLSFSFPFLKYDRCSSSLSLPCSVLMIGLKDTSRTSSVTRNFQMPGEHWGYTSSHRPLKSLEEVMGPIGEQRKERRRRSDAFTDWSCFLRTMVTRPTAYRKIKKTQFPQGQFARLGWGLIFVSMHILLFSLKCHIPAGAQSWTLWQWASRSWAWLMRAYPFSWRTVNHFALGWLLVAMQLKSTGCVT